MKLSAHGIEIELPRGWEGRIYRHPGGEPILHAASFPLPSRDGDFGSGATERLGPGEALIVLKEYRSGPRLRPGEGLFASRRLPLPLRPGAFSARTLQVTRRGQRGFQHFFTSAGRAFCLYAVLGEAPASAAGADGPTQRCNGILATLRIHPRM